jgi:hypothetical protein
MPPIRKNPSKPLPTKPSPRKAGSDAPSVDITRLLANTKTQALGNKLMKVDIERGNANGRLDYIELPKLDAATRATVAGMMMSGPDVVPAPPPVAPPASLVAAEKAGPLKREDARYRRFEYSDKELLTEKGLPGTAFDRQTDAYRYNPFVASESNLADPALLRAQARFLELTSSTADLRPKTQSQRNELMKDLKSRLTNTGLDAMELAYFPAEKALAIVKRAAVAAHVKPEDVLITLNGNQVRLPAWERKLGDLTAVPIRPYEGPRLPVTAAQDHLNTEEAKRIAVERGRQDTFFAEHPGATWSEYTRHAESLRNNPEDERFWGAMESWLHKGDLADWLPS